MNLQGRHLTVQMRGEDIKLLQSELARLGHEIPAEEVGRSFFGKGTRKAVLDFQRRHNLQPMGVVDEQTATRINEALKARQRQFVVQGTVYLEEDNAPAKGTLVRAFDKDLRTEELLGEAVSDAQGFYRITYNAAQFARAEKKTADLIVRAYAQDDTLVGEEGIRFNVGAEEVIDLKVRLPRARELSEYERLLAALEPVLQDLPPAELTEEDITFLLKECADEALVDQRRLNLLAQSARLARETALPTEFFYGVAQQRPIPLPLNLEVFLALDTSVVRQALVSAIEQSIIPSVLRDALDGLLARFDQIKFERGFLAQRTFTGRLIKAGTGEAEPAEPLARFRVRAEDLDADPEPREIGSDITNRQGMFTFAYLSPAPPNSSEDTSARKFRIHIQDPQGEGIHQVEIEHRAGQEVVDVPVPAEALPKPPTHPLDELATTLDLDLPQPLLSFLAERNIRTLENIRSEGGIRHLEGLPVAAENRAVQTLEAHANLGILGSDLATNAVLIKKGFPSITAIAGRPGAEFVSALHEELGDFKAAELHVKAEAQTRFFNNVLMGLKADFANGFPSKLPGITNPRIPDWFVVRCTCNDCEAAVSPLAYLADLLWYATTYLRNGGASVTLGNLTSWFHQPFRDLPTSCEQVERRLRQVRLCIEVLRRHVGPLSPTAESRLRRAEKEYLVEAYMTLLNRIGTSYDELRAVRADDDRASELADRLAIAPAPGAGADGASLIRELFLEPGTELDDPGRVTEAELERLFGLRDTHRDPLSDPADPPVLLRWRENALRAWWFEEDWPDDDFEREDARPLIDPDLIGPGDLERPVRGDAAYELWEARQREVQDPLSDLRRQRPSIGMAGIVESSEFGLGIPLTELRAWRGRVDEGEDVRSEVEGVGLTMPSFRRLLAVADLEGSEVLDSEWEEVYSIITQARKRRQYATWRDEERTAGLTLSPEHFRLADKEPELPRWRATVEDRRAWRNKLKARIEQQQAVIEGLREAVDAAEAATLTRLRDALIEATSGSPTALTKRLLIDCQADACHKTTRVTQAIETVQGVLFAVRTGQFTDAFPDLRLVAPNFDEERKWLGSYATWRAAVFVLMYPENVLLPHLKRWQTPAFRQLVRELRDNRRLTPQDACETANRYAAYFEDINTLTVEASCGARTTMATGDCRTREYRGDRNLHYRFARGSKTSTVYYSYYDPSDPSGYAQSFWDAVGGLEEIRAEKILGAVPHNVSSQERYIFLFLMVTEKGESKIQFTKFDLDRSRWTQDLIDLDLPTGEALAIPLLVQPISEESPLQIIVPYYHHGAGGRWLGFYARALRTDGAGWGEPVTTDESNGESESAGDWQSYRVRIRVSTGPIKTIHAAMAYPRWDGPGNLLLIYTNASDRLLLSEVVGWGALDKVDGGPVADLGHNSLFAGSVPSGSPSDEYYVFYQNGGVGPIHYRRVEPGFLSAVSPRYRTWEVSTPSSEAIAALTQIVADFTPTPERPETDRPWLEEELWTKYLVCKKSLGGRERDYQALFRALRTSPPVLQTDAAVAPSVDGPFDLAERLSTEDRLLRRAQISVAFENHRDEPPSVLTYLEEAWYFVPIAIALQLQRRRQFTAALDWFRTVYDYSHPVEEERNIYTELELDADPVTRLERAEDWLLDPLNPHAIAASRPAAYTRFTILAIIRCLLNFADAEFTQDTAESVPRARILYTTALELLEHPELDVQRQVCEGLTREIRDRIEEEWREPFERISRELLGIETYALHRMLREEIDGIWTSDEPAPERFERSERRIREAREAEAEAPTLGTGVERRTSRLGEAHAALLSQPVVVRAAERTGMLAVRDFGRAIASISGGSEDREPIGMPWLREEPGIGTGITGDTGIHLGLDLTVDPALALRLRREVPIPFTPFPSYEFCVPTNPILEALRLHAEWNLYKIRNCRNIAGLERELEPYAAPTDVISGMPAIGAAGRITVPAPIAPPPTPYRYEYLVERAKHLADRAGQMEGAFLAALEKRDAEYYHLTKARQDVQLARAGVRLQELRIREAEDGVELAELQKERAQIQADQYEEWLNEGLSTYEELALATTTLSLAVPDSVSVSYSVGGPSTSVSISPSGKLQTIASIFSTLANYERRRQEWQFQHTLALHDVRLGAQHIRVAKDRVQIVNQEHRISEIQTDFAEDTAEFLANKFTNVELYDWMSGVLEGVYSFFLQQGAATAALAEAQVAFERQEPPAGFIQADYWEAPSDDAVTETVDGNVLNRRGLTGSARLLADIYKLDQHKFETEKRKLQLTKTVSLARLASAEFQRFRETGVIRFNTTMEMFDRNFPGHYLRLIKRVRTSVIALIPPVEGIHATLATPGLSRVVVQNRGVFQRIGTRRTPELVALTSPREATGLFELQSQAQEMFLPFEGMGVDAAWEFRMPKASNQFDYSTIADVLLTVDYTALDDFVHRQQVIREFDRAIGADRPFSFRQQFADQWYDLHNPDQTATPMVVRFKTRREDFPPNITELRIQHVLLYFARTHEASSLEIPITHLRFTEQGAGASVGGGATSIDGVISTRRGNAGSWSPMIGKLPIGEWELALPNSEEMKDRFKNEEIEDILFVITYAGHTPAWPA